MTGEFGATVGEYRGTVPALLRRAVERHSDREWIRTDDLVLTFGQAAGRVGGIARDLAAAGVGRGDLVMLTARTTPEYLLTWLALASLGALSVPVNPASTPSELGGLLAQVGPGLLVTDGPLEAVVGQALERAAAGGGSDREPAISHVEDLFSGAPAALPETTVTPDDLLILIPTSGTTGRSKLVIQTHRAYAMAAEGFPHWMGLTEADRLLTCLPLFHVNAPAYSALGSLACGAGLVLLPRFSASGFLDAARRHGATEFNAIGAMLEILMRQPERPDDADSPLWLCYTGPAPERARQEEMERRFGLRIVVGYALSESPYGLIWSHGSRPFGTLGMVRQHPYLGTINEAKLTDPETGTTLGTGETGELLLRNPVLTPGYWGMPDETAAILADGWLRTGDLVTANPDGTYTFVGRLKEVLRRRGENLSPLEVQDVLDAHPAVLESAVVGVESELGEEEIKAFVVAVPGALLDFAELRAWAAERLSPFKVPRFFQLIEELPRTPTARIAKHRLPTGHRDGEWDAEA